MLGKVVLLKQLVKIEGSSQTLVHKVLVALEAAEAETGAAGSGATTPDLSLRSARHPSALAVLLQPFWCCACCLFLILLCQLPAAPAIVRKLQLALINPKYPTPLHLLPGTRLQPSGRTWRS